MHEDFSEDAPTDAAARRTAGRYAIDRLIARGGMAAVYLAEHIDLKRRVALKVLRPPDDADGAVDFEQRFRLEAQTLAGLSHPNIVTLHDFGELHDGRVFLAMEFIDGPRLADELRKGPMAPDRAVYLMLQVCQALRYAHRKGVIHRDLKPSNLLIQTGDDGEEVLKVVDFGLVKLTDADQSLTRAGLILGSPHCMSPEQVRGNDVGPTADVYAVGILLFRSLTGKYPFHGTNSAATMMAHLNKPTPTFHSVKPDLEVPAGLEEVVRKCLEKNPTDRYPTMDELLMELAAVVDAQAGEFRSASIIAASLPIPRRTPEATPTASSRRWWLAAAVLLILGIATAGAYPLIRASIPSDDLPVVEPQPSRTGPSRAPEAPADPTADPTPEAGSQPGTPAEPRAAEPREPPSVRSEPDAVEGEGEPEATTPRPAPRRATAAPEPTAEPTPRPRPAPTRTTPQPAPAETEPAVAEPKPADSPAPDPNPTREGYKGLPDDW